MNLWTSEPVSLDKAIISNGKKKMGIIYDSATPLI